MFLSTFIEKNLPLYRGHSYNKLNFDERVYNLLVAQEIYLQNLINTVNSLRPKERIEFTLISN